MRFKGLDSMVRLYFGRTVRGRLVGVIRVRLL